MTIPIHVSYCTLSYSVRTDKGEKRVHEHHILMGRDTANGTRYGLFTEFFHEGLSNLIGTGLRSSRSDYGEIARHYYFVLDTAIEPGRIEETARCAAARLADYGAGLEKKLTTIGDKARADITGSLTNVSLDNVPDDTRRNLTTKLTELVSYAASQIADGYSGSKQYMQSIQSQLNINASNIVKAWSDYVAGLARSANEAKDKRYKEIGPDLGWHIRSSVRQERAKENDRKAQAKTEANQAYTAAIAKAKEEGITFLLERIMPVISRVYHDVVAACDVDIVFRADLAISQEAVNLFFRRYSDGYDAAEVGYRQALRLSDNKENEEFKIAAIALGKLRNSYLIYGPSNGDGAIVLGVEHSFLAHMEGRDPGELAIDLTAIRIRAKEIEARREQLRRNVDELIYP